MHTEHADLIPRQDAVERVRSFRKSALEDRETHVVTIDVIDGHTLAQDIIADSDRPPRSFATMDGFAFDADGSYPYHLVDRAVYPEDDPDPIDSGEAIRISTGAPLPPGANAVLKREEATVDDDQLQGAAIAPGTYTYEQGSNMEAGDVLFEAGERLTPKDALLLGDLGYDSVTVYRPFSVGLLATGTEIHEGKIRDLDSPMLAGLIQSWGHTVTNEGTVPDELSVVEERIAELATKHDVVMTTGGTSVGKKDYVLTALDSLGTIDFHRVSIRPGKPIAFASLPDYDAIGIAIPGKPIGAHTIAGFVARPFFCGQIEFPTVPATLERRIGIDTAGFEYVIPVSLDDGAAFPLGHVDSPLAIYDDTFDPSVLSSSTRATRADGVIITETPIAAGEAVEVIPYSAIE